MSGKSQFSQGLFGCTSNCTNCLITCFVPCGVQYLHARAVEKATNGGTTYLTACLCDWIGCCCINRGKIREQYNIEGSCLGDCLLFIFCTCCTFLQDINEVDYH